MISDDPNKGLSVVDLYEDIKKRCKLDNLNNKLKKIFFKIVGKTPYEELNEYRYSFDYSKKNLMYYKLKDISTLINEDDSVTDISYKVDLSRKKNVDELSKDKFTSYLHFPN